MMANRQLDSADSLSSLMELNNVKVLYPAKLGSITSLVYLQKLRLSDYGCAKIWVALMTVARSATAACCCSRCSDSGRVRGAAPHRLQRSMSR
jgi:hypothetical protein